MIATTDTLIDTARVYGEALNRYAAECPLAQRDVPRGQRRGCGQCDHLADGLCDLVEAMLDAEREHQQVCREFAAGSGGVS